jgi:hypothetical protein
VLSSGKRVEREAQAGTGLARYFGNRRVIADQAEGCLGIHDFNRARRVAVVVHHHVACVSAGLKMGQAPG